MFFIGMNFFTPSMGTSIKKRRRIFSKFDKLGKVGYYVGGMFATAVIQSSDASVMLAMNLADENVWEKSKSLAFSFGARLGTTITALLATLTEVGISSFLMSIALVFALFCPKKRPNLKAVFLGFGLFFLGLYLLKQGVLECEELFSPIFAKTGNNLILFIIGLLFTAVIQSSSATSSILVILTASGMMNLSSSIFVYLGATVGTTATPLIASVKLKEKGRYVAVVYSLSAFLTGVLALVVCAFARERVCLCLTKIPQNFRLAVFGIVYSFLSSVISLVLQRPLEFSVQKLLVLKSRKSS